MLLKMNTTLTIEILYYCIGDKAKVIKVLGVEDNIQPSSETFVDCTDYENIFSMSHVMFNPLN